MGPQLSLIMDVVTYLIPGIIVFIFIPSYIISYFESWTFDESVYFAFVTLTTIGYGDYVAGNYIISIKSYSPSLPPYLSHLGYGRTSTIKECLHRRTGQT